MDRDKRWDRNKLAWDAIVLGPRECVSALLPSMWNSASEG